VRISSPEHIPGSTKTKDYRIASHMRQRLAGDLAGNFVRAFPIFFA
jgi:hypothetical protein